MSGKDKHQKAVVYTFSKEKLNEFKEMPIETRLRWVEETNAFIDRALGFKKRAEVDERFEVFVDEGSSAER